MLTTVIIAPNFPVDSPLLKRAKDSVSFADEILVFRVGEPISDFSAIRNKALAEAKREWVLFVDSDEEVTPGLAEEIRRAILHTSYFILHAGGFRIRRKDFFLGRWLRHGETGNARFLRLARKDAGAWVRPVHEQWAVNGPVGTLTGTLFHRPHRSVISMSEKITRYASVEASYRHEKFRSGLWRILVEMVLFPKVKFFQNYFLRLGFLDGMPGLFHALMMSFHSFLVRAYEMESGVKGTE